MSETSNEGLGPSRCSRFAFDQDGYEKLIAHYGENESGGEDFCAPWWDTESQCWLVVARYADCVLRQYADGWEWALNRRTYSSAVEAYEHGND
jgi:hypothetical protein